MARRRVTIIWDDDPEYDNEHHYKFQAEYFRLLELLAQKFLKREEESTGYRTKIKITQDA